MQAIYTDCTHATNNLTRHEEESTWKANLVARMLDKHHCRPGSEREVGRGAGRTSIPMASKGLRCEGIDVSDAMLRLAHLRASEAGAPADWLKMEAGELAADAALRQKIGQPSLRRIRQRFYCDTIVRTYLAKLGEVDAAGVPESDAA